MANTPTLHPVAYPAKRANAGRSSTPVPHLAESTCPNPVRTAWDLYNANTQLTRGEAIALAVTNGVATATARTQYQRWYKLASTPATEAPASAPAEEPSKATPPTVRKAGK